MIKVLVFSVFFVFSSYATTKDQIINDFASLNQKDRVEAMSVLLDYIDHEMFGIYINKSLDNLKKYGGLPGYYISHYGAHTSGGLLMPVLRVYDHKGKFVDTLVGGTVCLSGKDFCNLGGFSDPYKGIDFKLETDQDTDVTVRREIMNQLPDSNITTNQKYYTPDFVKNAKIKNIAKEQEILSGKGYDRHIVDTAIRETLEEAGIELNKDEMIFLFINNEVRNQKTARDYTIYHSGTGIGYFMIEAGKVILNKNGEVDQIQLNKKAILNADKISKKFDKKTMILAGQDDAVDGIIFGKLSTLRKTEDSDKKSAFYYSIKLWNGKEEKMMPHVGRAATLVPLKADYKTSNSLVIDTFALISPSQNKINAAEEIDNISVKVLVK